MVVVDRAKNYSSLTHHIYNMMSERWTEIVSILVFLDLSATVVAIIGCFRVKRVLVAQSATGALDLKGPVSDGSGLGLGSEHYYPYSLELKHKGWCGGEVSSDLMLWTSAHYVST